MGSCCSVISQNKLNIRKKNDDKAVCSSTEIHVANDVLKLPVTRKNATGNIPHKCEKPKILTTATNQTVYPPIDAKYSKLLEKNCSLPFISDNFSCPHRHRISDIYRNILPFHCSARTPMYEAVTTSGDKVILKSFPAINGVPNDKRVCLECIIHSTLKHDNIVNILEYFWCKESLYLVMEEMDMRLTSIISTSHHIPESIIRYIMRSLVESISFIHSKGMIHRDIKSDNILIKNGIVKLADFGFSTFFTNEIAWRRSSIGSPYWMAPEVIRGEFYNFAADIWSVGIVLLELTNGEPPFFTLSPFKAIFLIGALTEYPPVDNENYYGEQLREFYDGCMQLIAINRKTAAELLEHPFLTSGLCSQKEFLDYLAVNI